MRDLWERACSAALGYLIGEREVTHGGNVVVNHAVRLSYSRVLHRREGSLIDLMCWGSWCVLVSEHVVKNT